MATVKRNRNRGSPRFTSTEPDKSGAGRVRYKLKLPKIDLKELARQKRQNRRERMAFVEWYARQVVEGKG